MWLFQLCTFPASKSSPGHNLAHSASVCFCFTSDGEVLCNYLGWSSSGLISLRCTQDLIQSSVFIRTSSVFFHLHWCRSSDVLQGSCSGLHMMQETLTQREKTWWMPVVKTYFSLSFQTQWKIWSEGLLLCSSISALGCCSCSEESIPFSAWRKLLKGIAAFSEYFNCSICLWGKTW